MKRIIIDTISMIIRLIKIIHNYYNDNFPIITSLTKFAQVEVNSFDIELSGSSKLSFSSDDQCGLDEHDAFYNYVCLWLFCNRSIGC